MATDVPTIDQQFLNDLEKPTDMPDMPWVQWRVENVEEMVRFLEDFEVRMLGIPGNQVLIQGKFTGMNLQLSPGDCLVLWPASAENPREKLGVIKAAGAAQHRETDGLKDTPLVKRH